MTMTYEQMWRRYRSMKKHASSNLKIKCSICDQEIKEDEVDIEYVKTKSGSELFMHRQCATHWGIVNKGR